MRISLWKMVKLNHFLLLFWWFGIIVSTVISLSQLRFIMQSIWLEYIIVPQPKLQQKLLKNIVIPSPKMWHFQGIVWSRDPALIQLIHH